MERLEVGGNQSRLDFDWLEPLVERSDYSMVLIAGIPNRRAEALVRLQGLPVVELDHYQR